MTASVPTLTTGRLLLRPWRDDDLAPFAVLNADPRVMEFFPAVLSRAESDARAARIRLHMEAHRFGLWAVEVSGGAPFIGFVGLQTASPSLPFAPAVEVGWRLAREHWGCGYATEAARAAVEFGFGVLGLEEIVSFTAARNRPSRAVMERLGMTHSPADVFEHPLIPPGHVLRRHVLYRLAAGA
jgi:ribosomal-protein-alanine N-acetyltransferase